MAPRPQRVGQEAAWVVLTPGSKTLALSVYFRWKVGGHSLLGSQQLTCRSQVASVEARGTFCICQQLIVFQEGLECGKETLSQGQ